MEQLHRWFTMVLHSKVSPSREDGRRLQAGGAMWLADVSLRD